MFDPLDGSSNVDAGIAVGTIFGIFKDFKGTSYISGGRSRRSRMPFVTCRRTSRLGTRVHEQSLKDLDGDQVSCLAATLQPGKAGCSDHSHLTTFAEVLGVTGLDCKHILC